MSNSNPSCHRHIQIQITPYLVSYILSRGEDIFGNTQKFYVALSLYCGKLFIFTWQEKPSQIQGPSKLWSDRNCIWGPLKGTKSSFKPVHLFLHFGTFGLLVLQLILASKLSELEHFENLSANNQFRKQKGVKMIPN